MTEPTDGTRIVHAEQPLVASPSGLRLRHLVRGGQVYVGEQWLASGERVRLHTHPVEEVLTFLAGDGEAVLSGEMVPIGAGVSLRISAGLRHGFQNTGNDPLHVLIVFPGSAFAETIFVDETPL